MITLTYNSVVQTKVANALYAAAVASQTADR